MSCLLRRAARRGPAAGSQLGAEGGSMTWGQREQAPEIGARRAPEVGLPRLSGLRGSQERRHPRELFGRRTPGSCSAAGLHSSKLGRGGPRTPPCSRGTTATRWRSASPLARTRAACSAGASMPTTVGTEAEALERLLHECPAHRAPANEILPCAERAFPKMVRLPCADASRYTQSDHQSGEEEAGRASPEAGRAERSTGP